MLLQVTKTEDAYFIEAPASAKPDEAFLLEVKFQMLAARWKEEAKFFSFARQYTGLDSFRAMVLMGLPIVPLILAEAKAAPHPGWLHVLSAITGENPVPHHHRGNPTQMTNDWLEGARTKNLA